jgi:hypothetical protein
MIIAVGGLGGSGTRTIAQLLIEMGIYMGDDMNTSNDNLFFTRLFKNPKWFKNATANEVNFRLRIFEKYMTGQRLNILEMLEVLNSARRNPTFQTKKTYYWGFIKGQFKNKQKNDYIWGWKEPNTQIIVYPLFKYFPSIKYIHVLRHGLDMAFSNNKNQLHNWGSMFGINIEKSDGEIALAVKQLDYWIKSTHYVIEAGKKLIGDNLYILNYQHLCEQPDLEVPKLIAFLGVGIDENMMKRLIKTPVISDSNGRYRHKDLSIFSKEQLREVINLGFSISTLPDQQHHC